MNHPDDTQECVDVDKMKIQMMKKKRYAQKSLILKMWRNVQVMKKMTITTELMMNRGNMP